MMEELNLDAAPAVESEEELDLTTPRYYLNDYNIQGFKPDTLYSGVKNVRYLYILTAAYFLNIHRKNNIVLYPAKMIILTTMIRKD